MAARTKLYGDSRTLLVEGLVSIYDSTLRDEEPRLVSLEAPAGWGKTRVAHEFYAHLAARQDEPRYWPDEIADADRETSIQQAKHRRRGEYDESIQAIHARRKMVRPMYFERPGGSVPEFFWWGIACFGHNGIQTSNLGASQRQFYDHEIGLGAAIRQRSSTRQRILSKAKSVGVAEVAEIAQEATVKAIGAVVKSADDWLPTSARWVKKGIGAAWERQQEKREVREPSTPDATGDNALVSACIEQCQNLLKNGLPIVILVEDIHDADDNLLILLGKLLSLEGPLLIITTTLPDMANNSGMHADILTGQEDRIYRIGHQQEAGTPFPNRAGLTSLEPESRYKISTSCCPQLAAGVHEALTERYVNPLALELACQVLMLKKRASELSSMSLAEVSELPETILELYDKIWSLLPRENRIALSVAQMITPASIYLGTDRELPNLIYDDDEFTLQEIASDTLWTDSILRNVIERVQFRNGDEILENMANAPHAYSFVQLVDRDLRSFTEHPHSQIASSHSARILREELGDNGRLRVLEALTSAVLDTRHRFPDTVNRAHTIVALHIAGLLDDSSTVTQSIDKLLHEYEVIWPQAAIEMIALYNIYLSLDRESVPDELNVSIIQAHVDALTSLHYSHHDVSDKISIRMILTAEKTLLQSQLDLYGPGDELALNTYRRIAELVEIEYLDLDYRQEVIPAWKALVGALSEQASTQFDDHLRARKRLCEVLCVGAAADLNRHNDILLRGLTSEDSRALYTEAAAELEALSHDWSVRYGVDDVELRGIQTRLAEVSEKLGQFEKAENLYRAMSGQDSEATIRARYGNADVLAYQGDIEEAIAVNRRRHRDQCAVLGTEHRSSRLTRYKLGRLLGASGQVGAAIEEFEALMDDRLLGLLPFSDGVKYGVGLLQDARTTERLDREGSTAYCDSDLIQSACQELLSHRYRPLDAETQSVLSSFWLQPSLMQRPSDDHRSEDDDIIERTHLTALRAFEALANYCSESYDQDDDRTLAATRGMAFCLGTSGRPAEAAERYQDLIVQYRRRHDAYDQYGIRLSHGCARWLCMSDQTDEAVQLYRELLQQYQNSNVSGDPYILVIQRGVADCLNRLQRFEDAVLAAEDLLRACRDLLEKDHPDTLDAHKNYAACLWKAGRGSDAISEAHTLLEAQEDTLSAEHADLKLTRDFIDLADQDVALFRAK